jgi:hypothetical protein
LDLEGLGYTEEYQHRRTEHKEFRKSAENCRKILLEDCHRPELKKLA